MICLDDSVKTRVGVDALAVSPLEIELSETMRQIAELRIDDTSFAPDIPRNLSELKSFAVEAEIEDKITEDNFWEVRGKVRAYFMKQLKEETNKKRKLIKDVSKTDLFGGMVDESERDGSGND